MKILIVGIGKIKYMPYLNIYLESISEIENALNTYHLLYWNRDTNPDLNVPKLFSNFFKYEGFVKESNGLISKIPHFLGYRRFAMKIFENNYDLVVILHSVPGLLLIDQLTKKKIKYILDFRDISHENNFLYKIWIDKLVLNSVFTFISSDGFRSYLPSQKKLVRIHNVSLESLIWKNDSLKYKKGKKIIIRYWGLIRHYGVNKRIIKALNNNPIFEIHFHGREQGVAIKLKKLTNQLKSNNVFFHGEYYPIEKNEFSQNTHIIHNMYNNDVRMKNALSNKYYDGIIYKIPQMCTAGSYMGRRIVDKKLGISINTSKDISSQIVEYLNNLNYENFYKCCIHEKELVMNEYNQAKELIKSFFTSKLEMPG